MKQNQVLKLQAGGCEAVQLADGSRVTWKDISEVQSK